MAEFVQQCIEEMIPEVEEMERAGLFTREELKKVLRKRQGCEYRLRKRTKRLRDYLEYIQYEMNVLALVKKRRKRVGYRFKRLEIDVTVVQRIHKLFNLATLRFGDDLRLWLSHIQFCRKMNERKTEGRVMTRMLQVHSQREDLWLLVGRWEFQENSDPDSARRFFQRGLRFVPESKRLWLEYYRMELLYADRARKRLEALGTYTPEADDTKLQDPVVKGEIALLIFKKALLAFPDDVGFLLAFIPIVRLFDFCAAQEEEIFKILKSSYPDKELTWDALARRELYLAEKSQASTQKISKDCHECCFRIYDEAVEKIPTELMWMLYVTCMEEMMKKSTEKSEKIIHHLLKVFESAANKNLLSYKLYIQWLEVLTNVGLVHLASQVVEVATSKFPHVLSLWEKHLLILIQSLKPELEVQDVFSKAVASTPKKESWPLWELILNFYMSTNPSQVDLILQQGLMHPEIATNVKDFYLEWAYLKNGILKAREVFRQFCQLKPVSLEFFKKYIKVEMCEAVPKIKYIRKAYDYALEHYGKVEPDLWVDYIKLELNHSKVNPEKVGQLHFKACKILEKKFKEKFIELYTLVQTGHLEQ